MSQGGLFLSRNIYGLLDFLGSILSWCGQKVRLSSNLLQKRNEIVVVPGSRPQTSWKEVPGPWLRAHLQQNSRSFRNLLSLSDFGWRVGSGKSFSRAYLSLRDSAPEGR